MLQWRNSKNRFGWIGRLLHWTGVALVIAIYVGISDLDAPPKVFERETVVTTHVTLGLAFALLVAARLIWRLTSVNPVLGWRLSRRHERFVIAIHRTLYVVVISICVSGWLAIGQMTVDLHEQLAWLLLPLLAVHAGMALINLLLAKDDPI